MKQKNNSKGQQGVVAFEKVLIGIGKDMKPIFGQFERISASHDGFVSVRLTR